ncbi:hypothetical protein POM88_029348 [Heracleum sosnowskyi]|uniref:Glycine-rich protein n=1 Tax=Heracleum sosnowskyi TaxID=360622 RepID=A0AAD8MES1_9APIA|nr:hypothetical protein POM88_029348 [Heracleum sosnowskyi]
MTRSSVVYCCVILVMLLVNAVLANAIEKDNALGSKKDVKATGAEVESSKPRWFGGGYYWGRPGGWSYGGSGSPGRAGCGGNGGGPGGGAGGCGGSPGQPDWGGRGGNGGGAGGGAGGAGGYTGETPGSNNGGRSSGRGGAVGGSPPPPRAADGDQDGSGSSSMPNPNDPMCGNIQMVQVPNGFLISYDCGNCNYQYTIDYNGMTTGYGSVTCF